MRGLELTMERKRRRYYARYLAGLELPTGQALDEADAAELRLDNPGQSRSVIFQQAELVRALVAAGRSRGDIASDYTLDLRTIERFITTPRLAPTSVTADIDARVLAECPETYEPGRVVQPTGRFTIPGESFLPDPHSQFSGR
ncbi:MAG: hypothetical protein Q8Q14_16980 [Gemmatimonadales bacterium]|nr:hypothetical protein [Gemmatimonadales bacterium]